MSREILFPTHLDVLVVPPGQTSATAKLGGADLFVDGWALGPGVHLHWALPDPLTQGVPAAGGRHAIALPAVPDRWLVVRIEPPTKAAPTAPRVTRAWVIDSVAQTATALASWTPTTPAASAARLTVLGTLPGGVAPVDDAHPENLAIDAAYYPRAGNRFGFHDALANVSAGKLSYLVIGWYARSDHDPMNVPASVQAAWLEARRCLVDDGAAGATVTAPIAGLATAPAGATPARVGAGPILGALAAAFTRAGVPVPAALGPRPALLQPLRDLVAIAIKPTGDRLICHGAVCDVPWRVDGPSVADEPVPGARLYGSLHEAAERYLADVSEEAWLRDYLTALLGRAGQHTASFLDAAWHGHSAGFVSHLGASATAPRFHAADAPAVIVDGLPRSLRHGEDADLDPERADGQPGRVRCRTRARIVSAVRTTIGTTPVTVAVSGLATPLVAAGLPAATAALLDEAMALDHGNLEALAARVLAAAPPATTTGDAFSAAVAVIAAWYQASDPKSIATARGYFVGAPPMPFAAKGYWPNRLPLYVELSGTIAADREGERVLPSDWRLGVIDLERTAGSAPTLGPATTFKVRRVLTPVLARMLGSATASGVLREARVLACTLPEVEGALPAGATVRAGQVRITRLQVIDTFGQRYPVVGTGANAASEVSCELVPRLAGWARLHARLLDRASTADASETLPPVCGFVLADRVDHALEIFDARGARIGQLRHQDPGPTATVIWEPDPARAAIAPARSIGDPARVLAADEADGVLLGIVRGLLDAPGPAAVGGVDSAVSALIRALDALQSTAARTASGDEIGPLLGRPLAVVRMSARLERVVPGALDPRTGAQIAEAPAPATFTVPLAFGAVTRADDGVFGYFLDGDFGIFHPVDGDAISPSAPAGTSAPPAPVAHPYLARSPVVDLPAGQTRVATLLVDPRLAIHVRTGVLPAKRIAMPTAMYQPALRDLAPSIRVGPVLLPPTRPWLPTPYLPGSGWRWLHVAPVAAGVAVAPPVEDALAAPAAHAGLSEDAAVAQDGWLRLVPAPRT